MDIICICGGVYYYDRQERTWRHKTVRRDLGFDGVRWQGDKDCQWTILFVLCTMHRAFRTPIGEQVWRQQVGGDYDQTPVYY